MSVTVLIPYRPGCPHRTAALTWVLTRHAGNGWPVVIGRGDERGPWVKADAVADALRQTRAETLIVADADVWTDGLPTAVANVTNGAPWAMPHKSVERLTAAGTERFMAGEPWPNLPLAQRGYRGAEGGGIVVLRRDVYETCPLDPRFRGWGSEDESWGMALRTLLGPVVRGKAHLVHLFHPPQARARRAFGSLEGWELRKRYARATGNPAAIRALIEEARTHVGTRPDDPAVQPDPALAVR